MAEQKKLPSPEQIKEKLKKQIPPQIRTTHNGIEIKRHGSDTWIAFEVLSEAFDNFINRRRIN